ncbi:hypothetical protein LTR66_015360, partial [Elasticomyces elasticus]
MSLKQEIETWVTALAHYDNNEFDDSLTSFDAIADTSKILFNCGVIRATLGEHNKAVDCYQRAVRLDQYLAVAYFQQGVSNFLMGDFEEALANFNDTLLYLRGNNNIDYEQLGLKFKLYSCEVLFNRGLCYIYLQQKDAGMQDLMFAAKEKVVPDHDVIDEAIQEQAEGYTVFSIPVGIVYRPNEAKVKNLKTKDYLGKARIVAAFDLDNSGTALSSAEARRDRIAVANMARDDRPEEKLSYAALNLVKPGLTSRSRQQSEPPIHRNMFPPTPPPESDRPFPSSGKRRSAESARAFSSSGAPLRSAAPKPQRLELGAAAFERASPEKPRLGTARSASERPRPTREYSNASSRSQDSRRANRRSIRETPLRRITSDDEEESVAADRDDLVDAYRQQPKRQSQPQTQQTQLQLQPTTYHRRSKSGTQHQRPMYIEEEREEAEEDETASSAYSDSLAFDIIPPPMHHQHLHLHQPQHPPSRPRQQQRQQQHYHRTPSRRPEIRKVRIKVHAEETRYVLLAPDVTFA